MGDQDIEPAGEPLPEQGRKVNRFCPNCGTELHGEWCAECGQRQRGIDRYLISLVSDLLEDVFAWDSRASRTLFALLFRPGYLAREYFAGRRARYVPPLRLYLISSVAFFFIVSVETFVTPPGPMIHIEQRATEQEPKTPEETSKHLHKQVTDEIDQMEFNALSPETNLAIKGRLNMQLNKAIDIGLNNPREFLNAILNVAPPVLFLLMPIFAAMLKLVFIGSGRYYTEHLILAVYNHSFLFVALIARVACNYLGFLWPWGQQFSINLISAWIVIYMFWSLLEVYRQGFLITVVKFSILSFLYSILFVVGVAFSVVLGVMTL